jgi:hypothetical protein
MRAVLTAVAIGGVAELVVYRSALKDYSEAICILMFVAAAAGALALGRLAPGRLLAFCGSVALAAPGIAYSMIGHGLLEMGGFLHAFAAGIFGIAAWRLFHGQRPWRDPAVLKA